MTEDIKYELLRKCDKVSFAMQPENFLPRGDVNLSDIAMMLGRQGASIDALANTVKEILLSIKTESNG